MLSAHKQGFADHAFLLHRSTAHETPLKTALDEEVEITDRHGIDGCGLLFDGPSTGSKVMQLDLSKVSKPLSPSS